MKISKTKLIKFIKRYYLTGEIDKALWMCEEGTLYTINAVANKRLHLKVDFHDSGFPDMELGIYSTNNILKALSILEGDITVELSDVLWDDGTIRFVQFTDGKTVVKERGAVKSILDVDSGYLISKDFDISLDLTIELINEILKCLSAQPFKPEYQDIVIRQKRKSGEVIAIFGFDTSVEIIKPLPSVVVHNTFSDCCFLFAGDIFKIFKENMKSFQKAHFMMNAHRGISEIQFTDNDIVSTYWLKFRSQFFPYED